MPCVTVSQNRCYGRVIGRTDSSSYFAQHGLSTATIKHALDQQWARKKLGKSNGRRDEAVVELLSSPIMRAGLFVAKLENKTPRSSYYLLSPEFTIFTAFVPEWQKLVWTKPRLEPYVPTGQRSAVARRGVPSRRRISPR